MEIKVKDIEKIKRDFDTVIEYSQNILDPRTDYLFEEWFKAKRYFIDELFDGNLIYEFKEKMSFELNEDVKKKKTEEFLNMIESFWHNNDLYDFVKTQIDGFFNNEVIINYNVQDKKIRKGTKLIKAFKFFASGRELENIQNEASRIIQENKVEGHLCLSVHPLDFLSLSENNYKWRSCHALDGEYRAGNLSYLVDEATIICYLKGDDEEAILPHFPSSVSWNTKKWRTLLYFSEDKSMIFAGRQYPFALRNALTFVLENFIRTKMEEERKSRFPWQRSEKICWSNWTDTKMGNIFVGEENIKCCSDWSYIPLGDGLIRLTDLVKDAPDSRHFNDVLNSSCYDPIYTFKYLSYDKTENYGLTSIHKTHFNIGKRVECLHCGNGAITDAGDTMLCDFCRDEYEDGERFYCDCCGYSSIVEDEFCWIDNETICTSCYDEYFNSCERCGESYRKEELIYDKNNDRFLCECCYKKLEEN